MIAFLTGRLALKTETACTLDVGGVGYRLLMSTASLAALPAEGDSVTVHTYLHVREDGLTLFGFESAEEKELFEALIGVSGVGPKVALAALSAFKPNALRDAIAREDAALVASVPGIGKKTAERMIVDLKDKLGATAAMGGTSARVDFCAAAEAREALLAMGFSPAEVSAALKGYGGEDDANALLKHALKRLGGAA